MTRFPLCVLALVAAAATGCQSRVDLPPPSELADRNEAVREQVTANEPLFLRGDAAGHLPRLDAVLKEVAARYGAKSIELSQAATDTGLLLIKHGDRYDLAEPYFERALQLSREVFGTRHRETGYALHDLAIVRNETRPETFWTRVRPLMKEAIEIRSRVLGPKHKETAASERTLAGFLLAGWRRQANPDPRSEMLTEADHYASHALPALEGSLGKSHFEVIELRYTQIEIALAIQDFRRAGSLARELVSKHQLPCNSLGQSPNARDLQIAALRGEGRTAQADELEKARPGDECGLLPPDSDPAPLKD